MASPRVSISGGKWNGDLNNRRDSGDSREHQSPNHRNYVKHSSSSPNSKQWNKGPSRGPSSPLHSRNSTSDQLSHMKRQWDVQRDIPSGTVRNNPFLPKPEPGSGPPPQIVHKQKQWDTSTIQRGSVAARAMEAEDMIHSPANNSKVSPSMMEHRNKFERRASPLSKSPVSYTKSSPQPKSSSSSAFAFDSIAASRRDTPQISSPEPPALRGSSKRMDTSTYQQPAPVRNTGGKWNPSKEIPAGAVRGRVSNFVGTAAEPPSPQIRRQERSVPSQKYVPPPQATTDMKKETTEDDPFIIPTHSGRSKVKEDHWGEALRAKSSDDESDGWDAPAVDWVKSQDSTKDSMENIAAAAEQPQSRSFARDYSHEVGILEEKKLNEDDSLVGRDSNIFHAQQRKKTQYLDDRDVFETAQERDSDILKAAKKKTSTKKQPDFDVFDANGFPAASNNDDNAFQTFDAFPSSPFSAQNTFNAFQEDPTTDSAKSFQGNLRGGQDPSELTSTKAPTNTNTTTRMVKRDPTSWQKERVQKTASSRMPNYSMPSSDDQDDSLPDSFDEDGGKKSKKGFFGKFFGGRKGRKSTDSVGSKPRGSLLYEQHLVVPDRASLRVSPKNRTSPPATAPVKATSSPKKALSAHILSGKNGDDHTVVSEMTMPTIFKEAPRATTVGQKVAAVHLDTVPSLEQQDEPASITVKAVSEDTAIDSESGHFHEEKKVEPPLPGVAGSKVGYSQPPPPPPPPPPPRSYDADSIEKARGGSIMDGPTQKFGKTTAFDTERLNRKVKELKKKSAVKAQTVVSVSQEPFSAPTVKPTRHKFTQASRAYQNSGKPSYLSPGTSVQTVSVAPAVNRYAVKSALSHDSATSGQSQKSWESSSVESDVRVLRSVLRRPRKGRDLQPVVRPKQVFATYHESSMDPMQRAGLRLLSAAVIPIQTEVRRFLAMRRALTRMWGLIIIQSYTRRHLAQKQYARDLESIVRVQALARGNIERNDLVYKHICAIEVQRHVRGYLSTMRVYEEIYKVTMVQSFVRMKLAMEEATNRMALAIQLQSVCRGFIVRKRLERDHASATSIQTSWRSFFTRLNYQFQLLDVIIVQSVWRKKMAAKKAKNLRFQKETRAAAIIQTKWRSYDATMNYLHFLADVLICQSSVRRFLVINRAQNEQYAATMIQSHWRGFVEHQAFQQRQAATKVQSVWRMVVLHEAHKQRRAATKIQSMWRMAVLHEVYKERLAATKIQSTWRMAIIHESYKQQRAATKIQSVWRGFVAYADFTFSMADIVSVQKVARRWLAIRKVHSLAEEQERQKAALLIQKSWRGFVTETEYVVMKYEHYAARTIQSYWRRFWHFSNYVIALDCTIQIQRAYRDHRQRQVLAKLEAESIRKSETENKSALIIQTNFRALQARVAVRAYLAARRIQSNVRGQQARTAVRFYYCARKIQAMWRGKRMYTAYKCYRSALIIQSRYRGMQGRREALVLRGEFLAASLIQSAWRGFVCYTDYIFTVSDIIAAQKVARRFLAQKTYGGAIKAGLALKQRQKEAATSMQKVCRGFVVRQRYWYILGCTMQVQSWMRGRLVKLQIQRETRARLRLQCFGRRCLARQEYLQRKFILALLKTADKEKTKRVAVRVIQDKARGFLDERKRDEAARVIQRFFLMVKHEVDQMVHVTKKRKTWRKKMMKKNRNSRVEEALLEHAWGCVDNGSLSAGLDAIVQSSSHGSSEHNENIRDNARKWSGAIKRDPLTDLKSKLPPRYNVRQSLSQHDDEKTEFSGLTMSTAAYSRVASSRLKQRVSREVDEDLELEEAFMDYEMSVREVHRGGVGDGDSRYGRVM